jgi:hypothetical protein
MGNKWFTNKLYKTPNKHVENLGRPFKYTFQARAFKQKESKYTVKIVNRMKGD